MADHFAAQAFPRRLAFAAIRFPGDDNQPVFHFADEDVAIDAIFLVFVVAGLEVSLNYGLCLLTATRLPTRMDENPAESRGESDP